MMDGEFLACDWGGTNLRAWRIGGDNKVLAAEDGFDFMLLDVNMPKMSGLECLRRLQELNLVDRYLQT